MRCNGKVASFRERKNISDASGQLLFSMRDKTFSAWGASVAQDANGNEVLRGKQHFAFGAKMTVTFRNTVTGQEAELSIRGDMFAMSGTITLNGSTPVAQINRKLLNSRELIADRRTFYVTVAPGVDLALIAGICIAFDEAYHAKDY